VLQKGPPACAVSWPPREEEEEISGRFIGGFAAEASLSLNSLGRGLRRAFLSPVALPSLPSTASARRRQLGPGLPRAFLGLARALSRQVKGLRAPLRSNRT
jgi:hypothetical protein